MSQTAPADFMINCAARGVYYTGSSVGQTLLAMPAITAMCSPMQQPCAAPFVPSFSAALPEPESGSTSFGDSEATSSFQSSAGSWEPDGGSISDSADVSEKPLRSCASQPVDVKPWDSGRFAMVGMLQDAPRNCGRVVCMHDRLHGSRVAVKEMPNEWVLENHEAFTTARPHETERPWVDIACMAYLRREGFPYACDFYGVFRDSHVTRIVTSFAPEGDLFAWSSATADLAACGPAREALVRPLLAQTLDATRWLHDLSIVHGDLSMENILVTTSAGSGVFVQLIDFGSAVMQRHIPGCVALGKEAYRAPETLGEVSEYDGFLSDAFALGVVMFGSLFMGFPWRSTCDIACPCPAFEYFRAHGFRAFAQRRTVPSGGMVIEHLTEGAAAVLEGLLAVDASARLTLGEATWDEIPPRPSVWKGAWLSGGKSNLAGAKDEV